MPHPMLHSTELSSSCLHVSQQSPCIVPCAPSGAASGDPHSSTEHRNTQNISAALVSLGLSISWHHTKHTFFQTLSWYCCCLIPWSKFIKQWMIVRLPSPQTCTLLGKMTFCAFLFIFYFFTPSSVGRSAFLRNGVVRGRRKIWRSDRIKKEGGRRGRFLVVAVREFMRFVFDVSDCILWYLLSKKASWGCVERRGRAVFLTQQQ